MMNAETFDGIIETQCEQIEAVLVHKAKEYAQEGDRLFNFKRAAEINETTPEKALWGMATKHLVSVMDLVNGDLEATEAMVDEKVGDMINYLILLKAVLTEKRQLALSPALSQYGRPYDAV